MKFLPLIVVFGLASFCATPLSRAQTLPPGVTLVPVATGLTNPLFVTSPPGDQERIFIVEQGSNGTAQIKILKLTTGALNSTPFLSISGLQTAGEQGLLGLAFDPAYASNGKFYVNAVSPGGSFGAGISQIRQYTVTSNPDVAGTAFKSVLSFDQPQTNHNGGWIGFSPRPGDAGNLYIATGDGGAGYDQGTGHIEPGGNAQNLTTLLGKILRIHIDPATGTYTIPSNNHFGGGVTTIPENRREIFAYGLRNPYRCSFDQQTGDLYIGDVGQDTTEEVDVQRASNPGGFENFGWRLREGSQATPNAVGGARPPGAVDPILEYNHSIGRSVTGGYVYRGANLPALQGQYLFGDFYGSIFAASAANPSAGYASVGAQLTTGFPDAVIGNVSSLGEDGSGEIYVVDYNGTVSRLSHPAFFKGEVALDNGVYYLQFPNSSNFFGYYSYDSFPYLYHFDLGFLYFFDAADGEAGTYLYDFTSGSFFYTSPKFPFPYLYDFSLQTVLYYYPDLNAAGHYTTNPRFFYNFATGQIITK